jgi:pyruvate formate lyase activating enzyme
MFFRDKCAGCGRCRGLENDPDFHCFHAAREYCGKHTSAEDVIAEALRDAPFYKASGGGVTFSGGECLLQADFILSVLHRAKAMGLHTAIDTSGCVPWGAIEKTLPFCDLYLYDIKCMDADRHRQYTGVDNILILENLKKLSDGGKEIWIRIPVIPDFNNFSSEMTAAADFILTLPSVTQVTLMPYHTLGASKYETLGLCYPFDTAKKITEAELDEFSRIFTERNIPLI